MSDLRQRNPAGSSRLVVARPGSYPFGVDTEGRCSSPACAVPRLATAGERRWPGSIARLYPATVVHRYSQPVTRVHTRSQIELILATLNTPRLSGPLAGEGGALGPAQRSGTTAEYTVENVAGRMLRPLRRRLSPEQRSALVESFAAGARQKDLAAEYDISIRSVKRLVRAARDTGATRLRSQSV